MWTKFFDLSSGGVEKTDWTTIYIELDEDQAIEYFNKRFGTHPYNVTCSCCGQDFSVYEVSEEPVQGNGVLIIRKSEIMLD